MSKKTVSSPFTVTPVYEYLKEHAVAYPILESGVISGRGKSLRSCEFAPFHRTHRGLEQFACGVC